MERFNELDPVFTAARDRLTQAFRAAGHDPVTAAQAAPGELYPQVQRQAAALAYFDLFFLFAVAAACAAPLAFLMRCSVAEKGAAVAH